ncbi:sialidase family protein [Marinimicrobium alkaliphilum]|uniref:sialidase family protein n=1 Tax=Marinimicrobium alkaliphilum TaxID=2202654 RepID=UPI000DB9E9BF|nr:sialidase family protein [Marinimicrobium alkaliphilum]
MNVLSRALACLLLSTAGPLATADPVPLSLAPGVFDPEQPDTLGLSAAPGARTFTVYRPGESDYRYNHGAVLTAFRGRLYVQWQSSRTDEDAPETEVRYAISDDGGETWSEPRLLAGPRADTVITNGGWWSDGETLVAYLNIWPADQSPRGGHAEYLLSENGLDWGEPRPLLSADAEPVLGVIEQDMRALACGRILTAVHTQPGLILKPYYTNDPLGIGGWRAGALENLAHNGEISRELEPSWYQREDESIVMVFRDQGSSHRILAAESRDLGATWSQPVETNFPDSRSKQSAGNLPDGRVFLVNNPRDSRDRLPLVISLSDDGHTFDRAYWVRAGGEDMQAWRYPGRYKREGYSYPKSYVHQGVIYVAYTTNKEDVEVTRIPAEGL